MSLRVLIAPDKFKGTLTAEQAGGAIAAGWWAARPQDEIEVLPMTDGGDGFGAVIGGLLGAEERTADVVDAAGRPRAARWWWHADSLTALIEAAEANGLAHVQSLHRHPFELDTRGVGLLVRAVLDAGACRILAGVGGSATIDAAGSAIERWIQANRCDHWTPGPPPPEGVEITVAVDVENPLLGINGCTHVYGPQKGLVSQQAPIAEAALERLAALAMEVTGRNVAEEQGAGAAGGLGFGFRVFLGATASSGFEIFANLAQLDERIAKADLILTGEGMIDRQSLMGKGTGRLAKRCKALGKRCVGFAGAADGAALAPVGDRPFFGVWALSPGMTSPAEARQNAAAWLERLAQKVATEHDWTRQI
jgi:glycerate 2-kinase